MHSDYRESLNISSDEMVTINHLAHLAMQISGKRITKVYDTSKPQGVRGRNSDNSMIKKVFNWASSISLDEGMKRTYPWIEEQVLSLRR